ncbi:MAG: PAS domain-containing protein, partial [Candidatus Marinimicrobia bacterium]|nr:PAS domain-containing protein [Candidatus Neomarinimicrobiota bacterium]
MSNTPVQLKNFSQLELENWVQTRGEKAFRGRQLFQWIWQKGVEEFKEMTNLSKSLITELEQNCSLNLSTVHQVQTSATQGTSKFLIRLNDGKFVETVLIPEGSRVTVCLSSQVGCALDCDFCATGKMGLNRNLTSGEIADQLLHVRRFSDCPITNIVFMGMGEPFHNYEPVIRAVVESLMLIGLSLSLVTVLQLAKNAPFGNALFWMSAIAGFGFIGLGFVEPLTASGLARISFAGVAALGLLTCLILWSRNISRAGSSLMVWFIVAAWTIVAAIGAVGLVENGFLEPAIAAGQGLILITLGFTLVHLVFGQSIAANHFLEDSGRRALALAGSEQSVWDCQVAEALLYVGPELERGLGVESGVMGNMTLRKWHELIHPSDRGAYVSAVEAAEKRGKGPFSQEFRLRRADGTFRWYLLRARAIIGEDSMASRLIGTLTDVTAIKRSEDRLLADAVRDRVTGLPNRALFIDRLERALRRANARDIDELFVLV